LALYLSKYPEKPVTDLDTEAVLLDKNKKNQAMAFLILAANLSARDFSINGS
jgi:hypothetical protein